MNKRVIFTIAGALLLFGGPLVLPAEQIGEQPSAQAETVRRA